MTEQKGKTGTVDVKALSAGDDAFIRTVVRTALREVLEAEMAQAVGAGKSERASGRVGHRSGYYGRTLITRVGKLELRAPQRGSRPSCASVISGPRGRWWRRWRGCTCRARRRGR